MFSSGWMIFKLRNRTEKRTQLGKPQGITNVLIWAMLKQQFDLPLQCSLCSYARKRNLIDHSDVLQNKEDVLQVAKVSRGSRNTHINHIRRQVDADNGDYDVEDEYDHDHGGGSGDSDNGDDNFLDPVSGVQQDS